METKKRDNNTNTDNDSYKKVYFKYDDQQYKIAHNLRFNIFVEGEKVPEDKEFDGLDSEAIHFLIYNNEDKPIAVSRIRFVDDKAKIERVGVIAEYRSKGIGKMLMLFIVDYVQKVKEEKKVKEIILAAELHAIGFYEKIGLKCISDIYLCECGSKHKDMSLTL